MLLSGPGRAGRRLFIALACLTFFSTSISANAQSRIEYEISFPNAAHHEAEVAVVFSGAPVDRPLEARMSRTSPGRYALHEFAKNVYNVKAFDEKGAPLAITRPNPYQWNISGHRGTVRITYTLFADSASGTYSGVDNTHAHLNMPATFMWARGMEQVPIRIAFRKPVAGWKIATQLAPTDKGDIFAAPNLQYFLDSPTEISNHSLREWEINSAGKTYKIRLAIHHDGLQQEVDGYTAMVKRVVTEQLAVFGEAPDFDYGTYTFIACYLPHVDGDGMEHRNSTILTSTRSLGSGATGNLGTVSHEFFHAWNVERLRPKSLEPFDFENANMSGELWLAEGFTSYYGPLLICRAGLMTDLDFGRRLSGAIDSVVNSPGRKMFSAVEMSMRAPFVDGAASADETNLENTFISYYTWGSALGLGLDLTLRSRFPGVTLDDYMRALWQEYGKTEKPYMLADLKTTLAKVTGDSAFSQDFFARYIEGKEAVDYESLLAQAGFLVRKARPGSVWLDAPLRDINGAITVFGPTLIGGPLYRAGIDRGDRILSLDRIPVATVNDATSLLRSRKIGETIEVEFQQRGERKRSALTLVEVPELEVVPYESAGRTVTDAMKKFREDWLGPRVRQ